MAYPVLADLKAYLGATGTTHDATMQQALDAAIVKLEAYTDRFFGTDLVATPMVLRTRDCERVEIRDFHTLTDLVVETDETGTTGDGTYDTTWTITTDFVTGPHNQRDGYPFYILDAVGDKLFPIIGLRPRVQVTAKWGWAEAPDDVTQTVLELASASWKRKDAPFGVMGFDEFGAIKVSDSDRRVLIRVDYLRRNPVLVG